MTSEPLWLDQADIIELHDYVIERTGGAAGVRDLGLLESALQRPANRFHYEGLSDLIELAAVYAVGIAKNHPFVDGNKRAAFLGMGLFLDLNGLTLTADDDSATATLYGVASGEVDEPTLTAWLRDNTVAR